MNDLQGSLKEFKIEINQIYQLRRESGARDWPPGRLVRQGEQCSRLFVLSQYRYERDRPFKVFRDARTEAEQQIEESLRKKVDLFLDNSELDSELVRIVSDRVSIIISPKMDVILNSSSIIVYPQGIFWFPHVVIN